MPSKSANLLRKVSGRICIGRWERARIVDAARNCTITPSSSTSIFHSTTIYTYIFIYIYIYYIYIYIYAHTYIPLNVYWCLCKRHSHMHTYTLSSTIHCSQTRTRTHRLDLEGVFDAAGDKFARHTLPLNPRPRVIANWRPASSPFSRTILTLYNSGISVSFEKYLEKLYKLDYLWLKNRKIWLLIRNMNLRK